MKLSCLLKKIPLRTVKKKFTGTIRLKRVERLFRAINSINLIGIFKNVSRKPKKTLIMEILT